MCKKRKIIIITVLFVLGVAVSYLQWGRESFPNKRILINNLCLPACRILMYKRITLEI